MKHFGFLLLAEIWWEAETWNPGIHAKKNRRTCRLLPESNLYYTLHLKNKNSDYPNRSVFSTNPDPVCLLKLCGRWKTLDVTLNSETFLHEWSSHYARCKFYIVPLPVTEHLREPQRRWSSWWQFLPESTSLTQSSLVFSRRRVFIQIQKLPKSCQWSDIGREALKEWSLHQAKDKVVVTLYNFSAFTTFLRVETLHLQEVTTNKLSKGCFHSKLAASC